VPVKPSFFVFAHGTSVANAASIRKLGLNEEQAKNLHRRGSARPGSFHVFELGPPDNPGPGYDFAHEFGVRHPGSPVVLIGQLPKNVFEAMVRRQDAAVERILYSKPEDPAQVVFFPSAFALFNLHVTWLQTVRPGPT
jgi:hypothetical protein